MNEICTTSDGPIARYFRSRGLMKRSSDALREFFFFFILDEYLRRIGMLTCTNRALLMADQKHEGDKENQNHSQFFEAEG